MNRARTTLRVEPIKRRACSRLSVCLLALSLSCAAQFLHAQPQPDPTYREAYDRGHKDGLQQGRLDKNNGKGYDLENKKEYLKADSGFDAKIHDPDVYYSGYRRGYQDGYDEGYGLTSPQNRRTNGPSPLPKPLASTQTPASAEAANAMDTENQVRLPVGRILHVNLIEPLSTRKNERGDSFRVDVIQDVVHEHQLAIPSGTPIYGIIRYLRRAGRIRGNAEIRLRFDEIRFADGRRVPISASVMAIRERPNAVKDGEGTIEGKDGTKDDAKSVAATTAIGAVIGVIAGGKQGGAIGAGAGAVIGLGGVLGTRGKDVELPSGTELIIRLDREAAIPWPEATLPAPESSNRKD